MTPYSALSGATDRPTTVGIGREQIMTSLGMTSLGMTSLGMTNNDKSRNRPRTKLMTNNDNVFFATLIMNMALFNNNYLNRMLVE